MEYIDKAAVLAAITKANKEAPISYTHDEIVELMIEYIEKLPTEEADINELRKRVADLNNRRHLIWALGVDYDGCNTVKSLKELINELVSYTQLPEDQIPDITSRTGKWVQKERVINEYGDTESSFVCSSCQTEYKRREYTPKSFIEHHEFCPHCGAKMRSEE